MPNSRNEKNDSNEKSTVQKVELDAPAVAAQVAKRLKEDVELWAQKTYDTGPRSHLGGSLIGHDCLRYLWLHFRWCYHEKFSGRMLRLFQRGHKEENSFIEYLRGIGCQVWEFDDENAAEEDKGKKQFRISGSMGHFGGSLDGIVKLPPHYGIDEPLLAEFKTNGTGRGFNSLSEKGMILSKPQHFAQTSTYGYAYGFRYVLYMNVNKNDDDLYIEVVPLSMSLGKQCFEKADRVIGSREPLPMISKSPAKVPCTYCCYKDICFNGKLPEKNCRSCKSSIPVDNAQWFCETWNALIPNEDAIKQACGEWKPIINGNE